jgi:hypothetical protein
MLRIVIAASVLSSALGGLLPGLQDWIQKANGKTKVPCKEICTKLYGTSSYGSGWSSGGGMRTTNCKCKQKYKVVATVSVKCKSGAVLSGCTGSQTGGSAKPPPPTEESAPQCLNAYIAKCAEERTGKYAQKDGEITATKVVAIGDAQCSDLATGCIANANLKGGFNVGSGERGHEYNMGGGWAWSKQKIHYTEAKRGDIAQFSSWREKVGYSSKSTGVKHTAVITADYDAATCGIKTLDQNPSPVKETVYHPCADKGHKSGKLIVYRLKSNLYGAPGSGATPGYCSSAGAAVAAAPAAAAPAAAAPAAAAGTCKDDNAGIIKFTRNAVTGCASAKGYCTHGTYGPIMGGFCPVTCGTCNAPCKDHHNQIKAASGGSLSGCAAAKHLCTHAQHGFIVRQFCKETCGECPAARLFEEEDEDDYSNYAEELRREDASTGVHKFQLPEFPGAANDAPNFQGALMLGAFAATALIVGMLGFGAWRMRSTRSRHAALIPTEDEEDIELTEAGLELE